MPDPVNSLPLRALVAFRVAGQHLNFTRAAQDLNVTREAVSLQIRALEAHLGVKLFRRLHRGLALTEPGRRLYDSVKLGLDAIGSAVEELRSTPEKPAVSVTTTIAFAASALIARLPAFHRENPGVDIRVIESDECHDLDRDGIDLAIRYGSGHWPNVSVVHLFDEETFPVCSARMAAENPELSDIANIPKHRLLHLSGAAHQWEDWRHLLKLAGVRHSGDLGGLWFSNYTNVVQAARDSHGVAIAWRHVIQRHIESGELVNPTGEVFKTGHGFYLLKSQSRKLSAGARKLHDWLLHEFRE
ncbi:MAG: LysR substrate-binding domain-containing protein [Pikeienuella sp.]